MSSLWQEDTPAYSPSVEIDSSSRRRKGRPNARDNMKQEGDLDLGLWDNSGTTSDAEQDNTLSSGMSTGTSLEGLPPKLMLAITRMQCQLQSRAERIKALERQVEDLQQDRNFLRSQIENLTSVRHHLPTITSVASIPAAPSPAPVPAPAPAPPPVHTPAPAMSPLPAPSKPGRSSKSESKQRRRHRDRDSSSSSGNNDSGSDVSVSSASSAGYTGHLKKRKANHKERGNGKKGEKGYYRKRGRATGVQYVIHRYKQVLEAYKETKNMSSAFRQLCIDRNTIANTAAIAELYLASKDTLSLVGLFRPREDTLVNYAQRCAMVIETDLALQAKVEHMKDTGELLPLSGKRGKASMAAALSRHHFISPM